MRITATLGLFCLLAVSLVGCAAQERTAPDNIILYIGDGMGTSHVTAAHVANGGLNLERFKTAGFVTTFPEGNLVTDSAASATAMATGHKTLNGVISQTSDGEVLPTVAEIAEARGMATGAVATCSVTHATPAAFFSHVDDRGKYNLIAEQMAASGVDVLLGGGWSYFVPASHEGSNRRDEKDLLAELAARVSVVRTAEGFREIDDVDGIVGLFTPGHPPSVDGRDPALPELTGKAIDLLSRGDVGFFLMVEGSQIDWAGHESDQDGIILETLDFDEAVGVGLDFAQADGRTLVIVTADHETGGFGVHDGSVEEQEVTASGFTTDGHTAAMVPIFAYGPGSEVFGGIHDNTFIGRVMMAYVEGESPPTEEP